MQEVSARAIALYLPQFHPIPENDEWWGKGFTEWTNTAKAKPLFRGHYQPHVPADLGSYDLRVGETRVQQADLARSFGIEAFCYYHYWFGGRRLLNRPLDEVVASREPDFPFCVCWANETWTGIWHGAPRRILVKQTYPGKADHEAHFRTLLPAFSDRRYLRVDGKPLFLIYMPFSIPDSGATLAFWRDLARRSGLGDLYIVGVSRQTDVTGDLSTLGYDAAIRTPDMKMREYAEWHRDPVAWLRYKVGRWRGIPTVHDYADFAKRNRPVRVTEYEAYPLVVHAWDNTPRAGKGGIAYKNPDPEIFRALLRDAVDAVIDKPIERRLIFLKSWNEWAEGNHLEPDLKYGDAYLRVVSDVLGLPSGHSPADPAATRNVVALSRAE